MNPTGNSHFNQARIEWAIRLRYSPMPELDMSILASQLNAFRIGELRVIGQTWEIMMERDAEWSVNSLKRKADAAGLDWQIVSDGSLKGDQHAATRPSSTEPRFDLAREQNGVRIVGRLGEHAAEPHLEGRIIHGSVSLPDRRMHPPEPSAA